MKPKIVVVGSANTDMVVKVEQLPKPGETVLGGRFFSVQGGKGANQAVAAARLGADVTFVARLGQDAFGQAAARTYQAENINVDYLVWDDAAPSGVALILIDANGENSIAVAPGANGQLSPQDVQAAEESIRQADVVLIQLEIPLETVKAAAQLAKRHRIRVILNPAPAAALSADLYALVDVLTPNETEAAILAQGNPADPLDLVQQLYTISDVPTIIMTLGGRGAMLFQDRRATIIPSHHVKPVDTVAAGDAFNGALAVAVGRGDALADAIRFANTVGAISVTRSGAQPSLPTSDEVAAFLGGQL
ncbi:MAG: ribokinase [Chloroflexota bacterium]